MTWSYEQGWPFLHRELHIQERYFPDSNTMPNSVETEFIDSKWKPWSLVLNLITGLVLLASVVMTYLAWPRSAGRWKFNLRSTLFFISICAIMAWCYSDWQSGGELLEELLDSKRHFLHYVANLAEWKKIPIAYAMTCTGYIVICSAFYVWAFRGRLTFEGEPKGKADNFWQD